MAFIESLIASLFGRSTPYPAKVAAVNELEGKPLRYLIGKDGYSPGLHGEVTEVGYGGTRPQSGIGVKYCNLFDETNSGKYGPYRKQTDTASEYNEGVPDADGAGFVKNLSEQFLRARDQGFHYVELDNPDAYRVRDVIKAVDLAYTYGLKVIAKNPGLNDIEADSTPIIAQKNVVGIIVEKGAGTSLGMDIMRCKAGKSNLPVWFVAFGNGRAWADRTAKEAAAYKNMGVTYSTQEEYGNSIDVLVPRVW